jgi:hypothetical protein
MDLFLLQKSEMKVNWVQDFFTRPVVWIVGFLTLSVATWIVNRLLDGVLGDQVQRLLGDDGRAQTKRAWLTTRAFVRDCGLWSFIIIVIAVGSIVFVMINGTAAATLLLIATASLSIWRIWELRRHLKALRVVEQRLVAQLEQSDAKLFQAEGIGRRLNELALLHGSLMRKCHLLLAAETLEHREQVLKGLVESFFTNTARVFEPGENPVRIGVSLYRRHEANVHRITLWDDRDVNTRENGLFDFYVGPKKNAGAIERERGLAGITFGNGNTQLTKIIEHDPPKDGVRFDSSNKKFYFIGGQNKDPGFRALITVVVPGVDTEHIGVLSIDSNEPTLFDDQSTVDLTEELGRAIAIPFLVYERLRNLS